MTCLGPSFFQFLQIPSYLKLASQKTLSDIPISVKLQLLESKGPGGYPLALMSMHMLLCCYAMILKNVETIIIVIN